MSNQTELKMSRSAYIAAFAGDAILLGIAWLIFGRHAQAHIGGWEAALIFCFGAAGAILAVMPFVLEYQAAVKMMETGAVISTLQQVENLEEIVALISGATSQWQTVQETSARTMNAARDITERMTTEAAAFTEFVKKANESEKNTLRLEIEKLRRGEGEWLQIVVRLLDHTYALHQAAVRSGQPGLVEQLSQFQNACRDVVRRIGLVPFQAATNESFDPKSHQVSDPKIIPSADAKVLATLATGFTFQGRLVRPALVSLRGPAPALVEEPQCEIAPAPAPVPVPAKQEAPVEVEEEEEEQTLL
jgi:molecular chaperone GrpE (heat shock protein)